MKLLFKLFLAAALACSQLTSLIAGPGDVDELPPLPGNPFGFGSAQVFLELPNGKLILAGGRNFGEKGNLARLNADGTLDEAFSPGLNSDVYSVVVLPDGKLIASGGFGMVRINTDGTTDATYDPNPDSIVRSMALQPDGKLLVCGYFESFTPGHVGAPQLARKLARLNPNGTLDTTFSVPAGYAVQSIALQSDGKIVIGGPFEIWPNSEPSGLLARLNSNGSLDASFQPNVLRDPVNWPSITALMIQSNGDILFSGSMATVGGVQRTNIARIHPDGSLDASFTVSLDGQVYSCVEQSNGDILLTGTFTSESGGSFLPRRGLARLHSGGSLDTAFDAHLANSVFGLALQENGKLLLTGYFGTLTHGRYFNDSASSTLTVPDAGSLLWQRSGTAPAVSQVTFERSSDNGLTWAFLGTGTRVGVTSNWELNSGNVIPSGKIRARGRTIGCSNNASSSIVEASIDHTAAAFSASLTDLRITQATMVDNLAGYDSFKASGVLSVYRFQNTQLPPTSDNYQVQTVLTLMNTTTGQPVPLHQNTFNSSFLLDSYFDDQGTPLPVGGPTYFSFNVRPAAGTRLLAGHKFQLSAATTVTDAGGASLPLMARTDTERKLLQFQGDIKFGDTTMHIVDITQPSDWNTEAAVPGFPGIASAKIDVRAVWLYPGFTIVEESMPVNIDAAGIAYMLPQAQPVVMDMPSPLPPSEHNGMSYCVSAITLWSDGIRASTLVKLPAGSGLAANATTRRYAADIQMTNIHLNAALVPNRNTLEISLADLQATLKSIHPPTAIYFTSEEYPVRIACSRVRWKTQLGQILLSTDTCEYVLASHKAALTPLVNNGSLPASALESYSNQGVWEHAQLTSTQVTVSGAPVTGAAKSTIEFDFAKGYFHPHFPDGGSIEFNGGHLSLVNGAVDRSASTLEGVSPILASYKRNCETEKDPCNPNPPSIAANGGFTFTPSGGIMHFTSDVGLVCEGTLPSSPISFGLNSSNDPVHSISSFNAARYVMAGRMLPPGTSLARVEQAAAALLYSGHGLHTAQDAPERPGTPAYIAGLSDYPGFNFRVGGNSASVVSKLAGNNLGPLNLASRCKYYTRLSGVTGMIQPTSFPASVFNMYGIPVQLDTYQLAFISNINTDSYMNGSLAFPGAAGFGLNFNKMTIRCTGDLEGADLAPGQQGKRLAYWGLFFDPLTMEFTPPSCVVGAPPPVLKIGLLASLPGVTTQKLSGTLSFDATGDIVPGPFGQLALPTDLQMKGPGQSKYSVRPISGFALNRFAGGPHATGAYAPGMNGRGFGTFFSTIDVPYFEDLKAHVQVETAQANSAWYISNGEAMKNNNLTAFQNSNVDPQQRGFIGNTPEDLAMYREPDEAHAIFAPLARKNWLDVIDFEFPLSWDAQQKIFLTPSWLATQRDLLIMKVKGQIDHLSATEADISFGASFSGLPRLNTKALVSKAFNEGGGIMEVVEEAANTALVATGRTFTGTVLRESVQELENIMTDRMTLLIDQTLGQVVSHEAGILYDQVKLGYGNAAGTAKDKLDYLKGEFTDKLNGFDDVASEALKEADEAVGEVKGIMEQLDETLEKTERGIDEISELLERPANLSPGVPREIFTNLINEVMKSPNIIPPGKGLMAGVSEIGNEAVNAIVAALKAKLLAIATEAKDGLIDPGNSTVAAKYKQLLEEAEPALSYIQSQLHDLKELVVDLRAELTNNAGSLVAKLEAILKDANKYKAAITKQVEEARDSICKDISGAIQQGHQWFDDHPREEIQNMLRRRIVDGIMGSNLMREFQTAVRDEFKKVETKLQGIIDQFFAEVNRIIIPLVKSALVSVINTGGGEIAKVRTALEKKAAELDAAVNKMGDSLAKTIGSGEISGKASITDESLRRLRLDGKFALFSGDKKGSNADAPKPGQEGTKDTIELAAFFEINEADSVGPLSCGVVAGGGPEISFGATCPILVPIPKGGKPTQKVNGFAEARIVLADSGFPVQLSGKVGFKGELTMAALKVIDPTVVLAFGVQENYIGAKVRAQLDSVDIAASMFIGQVCSYPRLKALDLIDRDTVRYLDTVGFGQNDFMIGLYVGGEGRKNLIDGVQTCLLKLTGGIGVGTFVFVSPSNLVVGARFMASVEGEVLCIARVKGELGLAGGIKIGLNEPIGEALANAELGLVGRLSVEGEVGFCPFCIGFDKTFGVVLRLSKNDQDLEIDF